jgi:hypothetical protein
VKNSRIRRFIVALFLAVCITSPASATELGYQDDEMFKFNPDAAWSRAEGVDATWIRIMVPDSHWKWESDMYVRIAREAKAREMNVMATLMAWQSQPTVAQWQAYSKSVYAKLGPYVDAWSPMNEPNHPKFMPKVDTTCVIHNSTTSTPRQHLIPGMKYWKRVGSGKGTHKRVIKHKKHKRVIKYKRAKGKRAKWKRIVTQDVMNIEYVTTVRQENKCTTENMAKQYRKVYDATAPVLAQGGAKVIVGDLCPSPNQILFMNKFYEGGDPRVKPHAFAGHPYAYTQDMLEVGEETGLKVWATEWGFDPRKGATAADWIARWNLLEQNGVEVSFIYDVLGGGWNTRMTDEAYAVIAGR